jgi:molecular chaperone DnaK (HSP70)
MLDPYEKRKFKNINEKQQEEILSTIKEIHSKIQKSIPTSNKENKQYIEKYNENQEKILS